MSYDDDENSNQTGAMMLSSDEGKNYLSDNNIGIENVLVK